MDKKTADKKTDRPAQRSDPAATAFLVGVVVGAVAGGYLGYALYRDMKGLLMGFGGKTEGKTDKEAPAGTRQKEG